MKRHFDQDLKHLNERICEMGVLAEKAIQSSIASLTDRTMAQAVIDGDRAIDELELVIDEQCIDLIARYQPVARDLRFIATGMKINPELERIADLAVDIAERAIEMGDKPLIKQLIDIPKLSEIAQKMVRDSIQAFVQRDATLARQVVLADAEADTLRDRVSDELLNEFMLRDGSTADRALPLLLISRHLERMCDHATNIAEDVIYLVEGTVARHHPETLTKK